MNQQSNTPNVKQPSCKDTQKVFCFIKSATEREIAEKSPHRIRTAHEPTPLTTLPVLPSNGFGFRLYGLLG
jgi:hypothetical protein